LVSDSLSEPEIIPNIQKGSSALRLLCNIRHYSQASLNRGRNGLPDLTLSAVGRQPTGRHDMFRVRDEDRDAQAANLMVVGFLCLFAFVVLFIFIGMNTEMAARSDASAVQYKWIETTGSSRSN